MKKILYVSANGFIGGAENVLLSIARAHRENQEEVFFLLFNDGVLKQELKKLNFETFVLRQKFKLSSPVKLFKAILEIRKILKENDFSIIHSTMAYSQLVMSISSLGMPLRRVWFQHGPVGGILDFLASLFPFDILLFNSEFLLHEHMRSSTLRKGKFPPRVIPLPVKMEEVASNETFSLKHSIGLEEQLVLGSFGRIARGKNYDLLIRSLVGINQNNVRLIIMGSPVSESDKIYDLELKNLSASLGLSDKIIFIKHQTNVAPFYKLLDLYIHPGVLNEGFGLTVAEAMYLGIPVISSPYGGLADFVKKMETAYVIKSREHSAVETLREMIEIALREKEQTSQMAFRAKN